jgi:RNA polymerase sigma-70 factor (ECF subfamily)
MSDEETTPDEEPKEGQVVDPPPVHLNKEGQEGTDEGPEELQDTMHLARAARDGEEEQFAKLYERVAPSLFAWARLRIPPSIRPFLDEQDVVQEVWLRAVEIIDRYDPDKVNFRAWIFRVAKNVLLEAMRKLRADPRLRMEGGPSTRLFVIQNCPDEVTLMSARMRRDERVKLFTGFVDELESPDKEILVHCGLEGLKAQDVADRMDLSREAVIKRWQRLRETLRNNGMLRGIFIDEDA